MTYRVCNNINGSRSWTCINCGIEHHTQAMADNHSAWHATRALQEMAEDPDFKPLVPQDIPPRPVIRKRRKSAGALR